MLIRILFLNRSINLCSSVTWEPNRYMDCLVLMPISVIDYSIFIIRLFAVDLNTSESDIYWMFPNCEHLS